MTPFAFKPTVVAAFATTTLLMACGGGGGGVASPVATLTGTAATGAALAHASVKITNAGGNTACVKADIITEPNGVYSCALKGGETAPFFVVVTDPLGNTAPLVSVATRTPALGSSETVNATPLTTAIVGQLNKDALGDALGLVSAVAEKKFTFVAADMQSVKNSVLTQLRTVLDNVDSAGLQNYDPFTTAITAATSTTAGNSADKVLDIVKVVKTESGAPAFATVNDPTPVAIASTTQAGASVPAPPISPIGSASDLGLAVQQVARGFADCFALPVATRVTLDSAQSITNLAAACQAMVTSAGSPAMAAAFKNDGYEAKSWFSKQLLDDNMTGAVFSAAEVMAMYPADASKPYDIAVFNVRYVDNKGTPGNFIVEGQNFPATGTANHSSTWWITGNQKNYDIRINTNLSRRESVNSPKDSNFRSGLDVRINGSDNAPGASAFDVVHVAGRGLPTSGLWYGRRAGLSAFEMSSDRGATPPALSNWASACSGCITFWMGRTMGVKDDAATTLREGVAQANFANSADGAYDGNTGARPTKGAAYTFKLYKEGAWVATETRRLLADLTTVTRLNELEWHDKGTQLTAALDIDNATLNGEQSSLVVDWVKNLNAEPIRSIFVSQNNGTSDNATGFAVGASSVNATPKGTGNKFTALTGPLNESGPMARGFRDIGLTYRTTDGSTKTAIYSYRPN